MPRRPPSARGPLVRRPKLTRLRSRCVSRLSRVQPRPAHSRGEPMSGPNTSYDPVQVTPLSADSVQEMVVEALTAFAAAATEAELKQARLAHAGDRSPIAL